MEISELSVEDLKALLLARDRETVRIEAIPHFFPAGDLANDEEELAFHEELIALFSEKLDGMIVEKRACNIKNGVCPEHLFSQTEVDIFSGIMVEKTLEKCGSIDENEYNLRKKFCQEMIKSFLDNMKLVNLPGKVLYESDRKWLTIVIELAVERQISPLEFIGLAGSFDLITRHTFASRQNFINHHLKEMSARLFVCEATKQIYLHSSPAGEPASDDEADMLRIWHEVSEELGREEIVVNGYSDKMLAASVWLHKEADRIYGTEA